MPYEEEHSAARAVSAVVGGTHEIIDRLGAGDGQYDVRITLDDGRTIALEVTSYGDDDWKVTASRIRSQSRRGTFRGETLAHCWWVIVSMNAEINALQPTLEKLLKLLEDGGYRSASDRYEGDDALLKEVVSGFKDLRVSSAHLWDELDGAQDRVVVSQSMRAVGTAGSLPAAIAAVFDKGDNQKKLARADVDERHLYVLIDAAGAGAVIEGMWPLPESPPDPTGVIDVLWVYSTSTSGYLYRTKPGSENWERFIAATGESCP